MKTLHIYGQQAHHDNVYVVGDYESLNELYEALGKCLYDARGNSKTISAKTPDIFVNDGEGYSIHCICVLSEKMEKMAVPYTEDWCEEKDPNMIWPHQIIKDLTR